MQNRRWTGAGPIQEGAGGRQIGRFSDLQGMEQRRPADLPARQPAGEPAKEPASLAGLAAEFGVCERTLRRWVDYHQQRTGEVLLGRPLMLRHLRRVREVFG